MRFTLFVSIILALTAAGVRCQPSCPGQGATLEVSGGRLGDDLVLTLSGSPGVAGVLGFDL